MECKKLIVSGILSFGIFLCSTLSAAAQNTTYKVQSGDTFYLISKKYSVSLTDLMKANNANENTVLYPGNVIIIPSSGVKAVHTVTAGETYWTISTKYGVSFAKLLAANNASENSWLNIGDKVIIPSDAYAPSASQPSGYFYHTVQSGDTFYLLSKKYSVNISELMKLNDASSATILHVGQKLRIPQNALQTTGGNSSSSAYKNYTVKAGDTLWSIANANGLPMSELLEANNMNESTWLTIGQTIVIPQHNVPLKPTPGKNHGEYLDWWTEAQYVVPVNSVFEITDFYTGKTFKAKRTTGSGHADIETLTANDTEIMKQIWGGTYSWDRRPVMININGRKIAASMSSFPHAGNEDAPGGEQVSWRSGGYGPGYNLDWVKGNKINGVLDLHFANSVRHVDGLIDSVHQENIKIAAGLK